MSWARYRLWCITEEAWKYCYDKIEPTHCPANPAHDIDAESVTVIETCSKAGQTEQYAVPVSEQEIQSDIYHCFSDLDIDSPRLHNWPIKIAFQCKVIDGDDAGSIRVWDATNNLVVAEITNIINTEWTVINTETIQNLQDVGPITWEFQAKTAAGSSIWIDTFWITY